MTLFHKFVACVLLCLTFRPPAIIGQGRLELTSDDLVVLEATETAVQLGQQFRDSIWPGYNLDQFPFIVYIPQRWALLVNAPPSVDGFVECPDSWPDISTHVLFHRAQYEDLVGQLAFDLPIDSLTVCAVALQGQKPRRFLEHVLHENFHQFQHAKFAEIPWEREELYPIENVKNTSLACLEVLLLRDALRFLEDSARDSAISRVNQFLAVRYHRWQQADPYVRSYEQGQEINEGTAKYAETKAISLVASLQYDSEISSVSNSLTSILSTITMSDCITEGLNALVAQGTIAPEDMPRNRIYPVGATQALLLDQMAADWKPSAERAGPDFTFAGLLRDASGFDSSRTGLLVAEAKESYDYKTIYRNTGESIAAYRAGFDSAMTAFESQPGVRIDISLNSRNLLRSRSSSAKKWLVDNGSKEYRDHYDIYVLRSLSSEDLPPELRNAGVSNLSGKEFLFQLKNSGLYEATDWSAREKMLTFFCPEVQSLTVDGAAESVIGEAEYQFEELQFEGIDFKLKSDRAGTISISGERISIELLP